MRRNADGYSHGQKVIDVFHALKSHRAGVDFLNGSRNKSVYQSIVNENIIYMTSTETMKSGEKLKINAYFVYKFI